MSDHRLVTVKRTIFGWVAECWCGWCSRRKSSAENARKAWGKHESGS